MERVRVRMYDVGFGDCFLISFYYDEPLADGRAERHMLIDFGSSRGALAARMREIAEMIESDCGGQLDVVAVTHRHEDHMSGFGLKDASAVIDRLDPKLVVRSWTENPGAASDAVGPASRSFIAALDKAQAFMGEVREETRRFSTNSLRGELSLAAAGQLKNQAAITNLEKWGQRNDEEFLHYGMRSKIEDLIPGATVRVVGPPTVEQHPEVAGQRVDDPEYWMLQQRAFARVLMAAGIDTTAPVAMGGDGDPIDPGPVRWLAERMRGQHIQTLRRIVRELDDALNNTSLILLIDVGEGENSKRMLFAGDAQIENWNFALKSADANSGLSYDDCKRLLTDVDLYKVGHHGSRNASPRTLVSLWEGKNRSDMYGLMSTMSCVHGEKTSTRVPRQTLVDALAKQMRLFTTDAEWFDLDGRERLDFIEVQADLTDPGPFKLKRGRFGLIKENDIQIDCGNRGL